MSDNIIQLNEDLIKNNLKDLVRSSVEETLMHYSTMKLMSLLMPSDMNALATERGIAPAIMSETFLRHPEM
jgi:hypothetical protein